MTTRRQLMMPAALSAAALGTFAGRGVYEARYRAESDRLHGKVALVAGASRGLGLLIATELARMGMDVVICARDAEELDRARSTLADEGLRVRTRVCDLTSVAQVDALVGDVESELGPVEVLVTVVGIIQVGPVEATTLEHFQSSMATTFWPAVYLSRAVLPGMRRRRSGHIATVTSIGGRISVPHLLPYSSAKFAAVGYHEGLRAELTGTGVKVTTIIPGLMRTGSHVNADYLGDQADEYSWFGTLASLPVLAMDARRAARRIVRAVVLGRPEVQLPAYTHLATRVHGLMPATTVRLLALASSVLPSGTGQGTHDDTRGPGEARRPSDAGHPSDASDPTRAPAATDRGSYGEHAGGTWWARYRSSGLLRKVTTAGSRAADDFNQRGVR